MAKSIDDCPRVTDVSGGGTMLTTDRAVADERETIALMRAGERRGAQPMHARAVDKALRGGPLTQGQKEAVKLIVASKDRTVGVQGCCLASDIDPTESSCIKELLCRSASNLRADR